MESASFPTVRCINRSIKQADEHGWFRNVPPLCYAVKEARGRKMSRLIFVRGVRTLGPSYLVTSYAGMRLIYREAVLAQRLLSQRGVKGKRSYPQRSGVPGKESAVGGCSRDYPATAQDHTHTTEGGPLLGVRPLSGTPRPEREKRGDRLPRHFLLPETNVTPAAIDDRKDPLEFDGETSVGFRGKGKTVNLPKLLRRAFR